MTGIAIRSAEFPVRPPGRRQARDLAGSEAPPEQDDRGARQKGDKFSNPGAGTQSDTSSVHPVAPESFDLTQTPTVDQIFFVLRLLQASTSSQSKESFVEVCDRLSVPQSQGYLALGVVETYLEASLFFPGGHWTVTDAGWDFLRHGLPIMESLDMLGVELGIDARTARYQEEATRARQQLAGQ